MTFSWHERQGSQNLRPQLSLSVVALRFLLAIGLTIISTLVTAQQGSTPTNVSILLASGLPHAGVLSTGSREPASLIVQSGQTIALAQSSGHDYHLSAGSGLYWTQVQQVPANRESLVMTPTLQADGAVQVVVDIARKQGSGVQRYSVTVVAQPGEWVQLLGAGASEGSRVYSTRQASDDSLYLKVEPF